MAAALAAGMLAGPALDQTARSPASGARAGDPALVRVQMVCSHRGERISGMNKICYYDCGGSEASQTVGSADLCPISMRTSGGATTANRSRQQPAETRPRGPMCLKTGERTSGMNKTCSYDCAGSAREVTIPSVQLCPLSLR
ncbi:hypothetical protein [Brevundimonas sp.]|uniref:hypothetical protein n=1 Tax=Brevundimonas sp. TaxID=1871086 RepID=UPI002D3BD2C5|nr:hypothetical protein [Brevundimonas sp.]HYD26944.1 hypothetical protein [Brevundimonas sp.]